MRANVDLDAALHEARERFVAANPLSRARYEEACAAMPGGNTRSVLHYAPFPLTIARGEGCRLWDADGHEYVDFLGEYTAGLYGHSHPGIRAAIDRALDGGINLAGPNLYEARLARLVCDRFRSIERVRFTNSGTEANLLALATATATTGRQKVLVFEGGYHGGLLHFATGGLPINAPHSFVLGRYNDAEGSAALIGEYRRDLAAILVEPMQGSGGCIPAETAFLRALRQGADDSGAVLIFDEVMTSRLAPGGLQEATGILPDTTTLGKYIGGGMSFGAFGGREDLMALWDPRRPEGMPHAGTFNNNVLTMSAGLAGIGEIFTPEAARALTARGEALRARLNGLCREAGVAMQFTGIGSLMTAHMTDCPIRSVADLAGEDPKAKELLFFDMLDRGIYMARRAMMTLSLPIGDAECDRLAAALTDFLETRRPVLPAPG